MLYGERLKYARKKLGLSRMRFAVLLDMTEGSIANVENCKDESRKLSYDKMAQVIELAELPKGWWFFDDDDIIEFVESRVYARPLPGKQGSLSNKESDDISLLSERFK